ncbi:MAG: cytochrome P450 [Acetobacteraceae bacterium]
MDGDFLPPRPVPPARQPGLLRGLWLLQRDALKAFPAPVYRQQMGSLRAFRRLFLIVNDPREIREVFIARHATYQAKSRFMEQALRPVLGTSLFINHGPVWAERREVVARLLHPSRLPQFHAAMTEAAAALCDAWAPGGVRDVAADLSEATTRIMLRTVFGQGARPASAARIAALLSRYQDVVRPVDVGWLLGLPERFTGLQGLRARATARALRAAMAEDLAAAGEGEGGLLPGLRAARREDGTPVLDEGALLDEVGMLLLAGSETSAATLAWALLLLANDPARLARLREELAPLDGRLPEAAEVLALPYTRAVLSETLRLYPPVPFLTRRALGHDRIRRWDVVPDTLVMAAPWLIQRKPDLWPEPERFRPERFLDSAARAIPKHAFIPFGLGPRICAGAAFGMAEMTVILAGVVQRFDFDPVPARGVEPGVRLTLRPKGGLRFGLRRR